MSESSLVRPFERWILHSGLVLEQVLGVKGAERIFGRARSRLLARLERRARESSPPAPRNVDRVTGLTPAEFHQRYLRAGRPVILSGAAANWGCVREWSLDFFSAAYGDDDLLLVAADGLTGRAVRPGYEILPLRDLVKDIRHAGEKYLRFSPLLHENPALARDLDLGWLEAMRGGRAFACTYYMFMGGAGHRTLLHNDQPCNLFVQIHGEKKWTLFEPRDSALLYPVAGNTAYVKSSVNLSSPDFSRHPLARHAQAYEAHLKPGDVLYVPPFVWHEVENLGETIAVGYRWSSIPATLRSSAAFALLRILSTNPPIWKTMRYGKTDTNLIWAHAAGFAEKVLAERAGRRRRSGKL